MAISSNGTVLARLAGGLYNQTLSNTLYNDVIGSVKTAADLNAFANDLYSRDFASKTDLQVANTLLANLGLTSVAGLNNWVAAQLTAAGSAKGAKIVSMLNDFANMTSDATYGAAATAFNNKATAALTLSQTAGSAGGDFNAAAALAEAEAAAAAAAAAKAAADAAAAAANKTFAFTTGTKDIFNGTANGDNLNGVFSSDDALNTIDSTDTVFDATKGDGDTLTVTTDDDIDGATYSLPSLTNIENIVVKVDATTTTSGATFGLDVSDAKGNKTIGVDIVRAVTGINATEIVGVGDGVTVTTGAKLKNVTIEASDVDNNINVVVQASGSSSAPVVLSLDNEGDNVITAAGHIDVTADSTGAVTLTAGKSATLTAADAAVVIASANGGSLTVDGSSAVSLRAVATGDIEITDGGEGDLTVNSSAGDVDVLATDSTDTTVTAHGDITFDGANTGDMNLTAGGDVEVTATEATDATIVAGGTVDFDGTVGEGSLSISAGGDITVTGTEHKNVTLTTTDGAVDVTSTGAGALKVTATDDVTVDAAQKNVTITTTGDVAVISAGAGALIIDAAGEHTVDAAQVAVTISGIGSSTLDIDAAKSLTVSGSGDEAEFDVTDMSALATITATGSQDVTLILNSADRDGAAIKILDKSTGTLTVELDTAGSVDLRASDSIDALILNADFDTKTLSLASGQAVTVAESQGATTFAVGNSSAVAKNTLTLNLDDDSRADGVVDLDGITVTSARTVTINASVDSSTGGLANPSTITDFDASASKANVKVNAGANGVKFDGSFDVASGTLTITSSGTVAIGGTTITAALLDASAVTGKVTATDLTTDLSVIKTGSGNDSLEYDGGTAGSFTVESGAGNDTLIVDAADYSNKSVNINLGDGTADTLVIQDTTSLTKGTTGSLTLSGVEVVRVVASTTSATIDAAALTGQTYALQTGTGTASATVTLAAKVASTATALDFTGLVASTALATSFGPTSSSSTSTGSTLAIDASANSAAISIKGITGAKNSITGSGASGDTLVGGAKDDTFTYSNSNLLFANKALLDSIDGGAGNDQLTVTTGNIAATDSFAGLTSVEKFSGGGSSLAFGASAETAGLKTFTSTGTGTLSVSTAAYTTVGTTVSVTGASKATVTTGAAGDSITLSDKSLAGSAVNGGAGDDTITVNSLLAVSVNGGTGNDTFNFAIDAGGDTSAAFEDADTSVVGGTGTDTLVFSTTSDTDGDDAITIDELGDAFLHTTSVEVLKVGSATSGIISIVLDAHAEAAGVRTIDISADTDEEGINIIDVQAYVSDVTIVGSSGADEITIGEVGVAYITAGEGDDLITLDANSLTDTVVLGSSAEANGEDEIIGFETGTDGDIIDFSAFLAAAPIIYNATGSDNIDAVGEADTDEIQLNGRIAIVETAPGGLNAAEILAIINGSSDNAFKWTAAGKAVLIVTDTNSTDIWYIDSSLAGSAATLSVDDIKLVGTLDVDGTTLVASNFA